MKGSAEQRQSKNSSGFMPPGIPNLGNTCYLSCIMQVIINCPPIFKEIKRTPETEFNTNFRRLFKKLFDAIESNQKNFIDELKNFVSVASEEFQINLLEQQDFFEIFQMIAARLPEQIRRRCISKIRDNQFIRNKASKTSTYETSDYDVFELVLDQNAGREKMTTMLERYFNSETDGNEETVNSYKKFITPPNLLFLSVPRVDKDHNFCEVPIKIDARIDITPYNELYQASNYYDLYGALYHSKDLKKGHYVIWLKSGYCYFIFDDSNVRFCSLSKPPIIKDMSIVGLIYIDSDEEVPIFKSRLQR